MKYKTQNSWTKESMIAHIKAEFKGKSTKFNSDVRCMYRGENGAKCAVGMFIPDDNYQLYMDRDVGPASELFKAAPALIKMMPLKHYDMQVFQGIHDNSHPDSTLQDMLTWVENNVE